MEDIKKIKIATQLADAMIKEIKDNKLEEDVVKYSENVEDLMTTITLVFAFKLMPILIEYAESEEVQRDMSEQGKAGLEVFKSIFK